MSQTDNADGLAHDILTHKLVAVPVAVTPHPSVSFINLFTQRNHHAEVHVHRHRFAVLARLIADNHPSFRTGTHIHRVVTRTVRTDRARSLGAFAQHFGRDAMISIKQEAHHEPSQFGSQATFQWPAMSRFQPYR